MARRGFPAAKNHRSIEVSELSLLLSKSFADIMILLLAIIVNQYHDQLLQKKCNHSQYYYNYSYVTRLESKLALEKRAIYRCMFIPNLSSSQFLCLIIQSHPGNMAMRESMSIQNGGFVANLVM